MGSVVWLMYLADLAESVSGFLSIGGVLMLAGCAIYIFIGCMVNLDACADEKMPLAPAVRPYVIPALIAIAAACLIPSKTTIYAAAAITAGDKALSTPTGDKAVRALNAWLDEQIRKNSGQH